MGELVTTQVKMTTVAQQDRATPDQFALVLRIQQSRNGPSADGTAGLRLRAQALVKDILMSRLEIEADVGPQEYVHAQGFTDLGKALAASRALQLAFEGFRSAVPSGRANISLVLDSFGTGPSVEQKDLLDSAKPSQVLITQAFYKKIAHCQPLALRSFPPRAGVYEFLWTSEERLDELQAQAEFMPTLVSEPAQADATVITPRDVPVTAVFEPPRRDLERPFTLQRLSGLAHRVLATVRPHQRVIAMTGAAAILIAICYLVIAHIHTGNRSKLVVAPSSPPVTRPVVQPAPPQPKSQPSIASGPVSPPTPPPTPPKPAVETRPTTNPAAGASDQAPVLKQGSRVHECSIAGLIPNYLSLAETNRIRGQYDAAIREYNEVLGCEPNNREAQDGLRRTKEAERLNGIH